MARRGRREADGVGDTRLARARPTHHTAPVRIGPYEVDALLTFGLDRYSTSTSGSPIQECIVSPTYYNSDPASGPALPKGERWVSISFE